MRGERCAASHLISNGERLGLPPAQKALSLTLTKSPSPTLCIGAIAEKSSGVNR